MYKNLNGSVAMAYIAGLIDGEGYMGLYFPNGVMLGIEMNDKSALELIVDTLGGNLRGVHPRRNHVGGYRVSYSNNMATKILEILQPYLIIKQNLACTLINYGKKWVYATDYQRRKWVEEYRSLPVARLKSNVSGRPKGSKSVKNKLVKRGFTGTQSLL